MIENQLSLPKLEDRFIEIHKNKCMNGIPISFFNKDKLDLVESVDENLIKYTYYLYKNIFFNVLHSSEITHKNDFGRYSENRAFNHEFTAIENKVFRKLGEPYINVRHKLKNRSEMSYFFNEFLENALFKHNVIHVINKDIWNLMKYVYYGYKTSSESNTMELLIPIDNKNVTLTVESNRSYILNEKFFELSHYWRMIYLFDRSKEDKDFFISLVLNTYINKNYSNINYDAVNVNTESKISIAEFIMLNYIKIKNDPLNRNIFLESFFNDHVKKVSSETQIVDYDILKIFLFHNKNEENISWSVNKVLESVYNRYPMFNLKSTTEAEDDEVILDDDPKITGSNSKKQNKPPNQNPNELILDEEPNEDPNVNTPPDDQVNDPNTEPQSDGDTNTPPNDNTQFNETDPIDKETSIYEVENELTLKSLLIKRKIIALNTELQNKQVNTIESNILDKWCKMILWSVTSDQSLKFIKKLKFKLP